MLSKTYGDIFDYITGSGDNVSIRLHNHEQMMRFDLLITEPIELCQECVVDSPCLTHSVTIKCLEVTQRNWSRVGLGRISSGNDPHALEHFFLKQNIDKSGATQFDHWQYEQSGAAIARQLLEDVIRVPELKYHSQTLLLNIFEHVNIIPVDELLRTDPILFKGNFPRLMKKMVRVLEALQQPYTGFYQDQVPVKQRPYGGKSDTMNFKGLDIRNVGFDEKELVLFDCVRPYLAPVEEAAAKIFISIGLLNWGKPLSRFIQGPDLSLLRTAQYYLAPYLDPRALQAEIDLQLSFRFSEIQGNAGSEIILKKLGLHSLGKNYLNKLQNWCNREIPPR